MPYFVLPMSSGLVFVIIGIVKLYFWDTYFLNENTAIARLREDFERNNVFIVDEVVEAEVLGNDA